MLLRIGYELVFHLPAPCPMVLMLYVHPSREAGLRRPDEVRTDPPVGVQTYADPFGNRCGRLLAPAGRLQLWGENVIEDDGVPDRVAPGARQQEVQDLPPEVLPCLLASRYCEVDQVGHAAWELFGDTAPGWGRVQAVCDWVHANVRFGYQHARPTKSACDVYAEQAGVCRDFTHLAVTFCRCLNIPARYVTGYLGDVGVPPSRSPMDFSAWFEAYLDGAWHAFDARHNTPR